MILAKFQKYSLRIVLGLAIPSLVSVNLYPQQAEYNSELVAQYTDSESGLQLSMYVTRNDENNVPVEVTTSLSNISSNPVNIIYYSDKNDVFVIGIRYLREWMMDIPQISDREYGAEIEISILPSETIEWNFKLEELLSDGKNMNDITDTKGLIISARSYIRIVQNTESGKVEIPFRHSLRLIE